MTEARSWVEIANQLEQSKRDYRTDCKGYAREVCGMDPYREQDWIFEAVTPKDPDNFQIKVALRSGQGPGKTAAGAVILRWFFENFPNSRALSTAPTFTQVKLQTWAEVHKWSANLNPHYTLNTNDLVDYANRSHFSAGISTDESERFRGFHEVTGALFMFEEGSGIDDFIYDAAEGSYQDNFISVILSNPGAPRGYFYDVCQGRKPGWHVIHINSETAEGVDQRWVRQMAEDHGIDSPIYQMKVCGNFPDIGEDSVYSLAGLDYAMGTRGTTTLPDLTETELAIITSDIAEYGSDKSVIARWAFKFRGGVVKHLDWVVLTNCQYYQKQDPIYIGNEIVRLADQWGQPDIVSMDRLGVGAGTHAYLKRYVHEQHPKWQLTDFAGSRSPVDGSLYRNAKAEGHFTAAEWVKNLRFYFGPEVDQRTRDFFKGDCLVYKYDYDSNGNRIIIDPRSAKASKKYDKDEKLKIKSPDFGDTMGQAGFIYKTRNRKTQLPGISDKHGPVASDESKPANKWEQRARELMAGGY